VAACCHNCGRQWALRQWVHLAEMVADRRETHRKDPIRDLTCTILRKCCEPDLSEREGMSWSLSARANLPQTIRALVLNQDVILALRVMVLFLVLACSTIGIEKCFVII
jgi:hypothetical protein